jgi:hypothetical protein
VTRYKILVLADFNLSKVEWRGGVQEDESTMLPIGITTDLEYDLIEVMLCCDLGQINSIPNQNGTFLELIFSHAGTDITVEICESPLLGFDRHHSSYENLNALCPKTSVGRERTEWIEK